MKTKFFDRTTLTVIISLFILCILGCIFVYSASFYSAEKNYGTPVFFLIKQIVGVVLGMSGLIFFTFFDYKKIKKFKYALLIVSITLLILVFIPHIGVSNYGARRWIKIFGLTFQPSEIAKFALVLFCSAHLADRKNDAKSFKTIFPCLVVGGIFCLLVILEPNMSITMCLGFVLFVMLFIGGTRSKHFMFMIVPALLLIPVLIIIEPYRLQRLMAFINPWASPQGEGFQLIQSLYALGDGGLFGVGLFSSRQKYLFLPFSESDFIFSIICEETGVFGAIGLILVFCILVFSLIKISLNSKERFGSLFVCGVACIIAIQVILNIAVVSGSIPPTGLPLPFISAGSTSLVVFMSAIGICLNVHKQNKITYLKYST